MASTLALNIEASSARTIGLAVCPLKILIVVSEIHDRMNTFQTKRHLRDVLMDTLDEWLKTGVVDYENYPIEFENAIITQGRIGWKQFLLGKLSKAWSTLQGNSTMKNGKIREAHSWAAMMVKTTLTQIIKLWYQRNDDVHENNAETRRQTKLERLRDTIEYLFSMKPLCRTTDEFLFPEDPEELLECEDIERISRWILTRKPAILHSVKKAKESDTTNTNPIYNWFQPKNKAEFKRHMRWKRDQLLHDPYNKKKRHKTHSSGHSQSSSIQTSIAKFFNPRKPL